MHLRQRNIKIKLFENFQTKEKFEPQHIHQGREIGEEKSFLFRDTTRVQASDLNHRPSDQMITMKDHLVNSSGAKSCPSSGQSQVISKANKFCC